VTVPLGDGIAIEADLNTTIGRSAYRYRSWRRLEPLIDEVRRRLLPGHVFIDGGANIGLMTLYAAAAVGPTGRVLAFEPAPGAFQFLSDNVRLNGFDWVEMIQVALSDREGVHEFVDLGRASGFSSFAPEEIGGTKISVKTVRLDDAVPNPEAVGMVKLDLEGAELAAIRGASRLLAARVPFIVEVEERHLKRQGVTTGELFRLFEMAGYRAKALEPGPNTLFEAEVRP
jgi:FkbM family methyltransferase